MTKQGKDDDIGKETPIDAQHAQLTLLHLKINITSSPRLDSPLQPKSQQLLHHLPTPQLYQR